MINLFTDRIHRLPRIWSNTELMKFASLFEGDVVNVSGWKDIDKQGKHYKDYFASANSYTITNYKAEARGYQGIENEIFLNLEEDLPQDLVSKFDVVFNHTTLEHIYDAKKAFANLCLMSRDVVILVLPFLQQYHAEYGDYWRFTPLAIKRMFEENNYSLIYQSFNSNRYSSVYTFTIASRKPQQWKNKFNWEFTCEDKNCNGSEPYIGCRAIPEFLHRVSVLLSRLMKW